MNFIDRVNSSAAYVKEIADKNGRAPKVGVILGSGLGDLADNIKNQIVIPYKEIPGFPVSTAIGHKGNLILGELGGKQVVAMQGRFHQYEGYDAPISGMGVRVMKLLGVEYLFVSNAAGGLNPNYHVGNLAVITDHINLLINPLIGPNLEKFGPRFPDMTCAYDKELRAMAFEEAKKMGVKLQEGVYLGSSGPTYETPAEVRFFRKIGGDMVGMSTVPEVITARHCGIRVFGMSCVTNICNASSRSKVLNDGEDVVKQADKASEIMSELFSRMIERL